MSEVEMSNAEGADATADAKKDDTISLADLKANLALIDKGVATKETRFFSRVLRQTARIRKLLKPSVLSQALQFYFPSDSPFRSDLLQTLDKIGSAAGSMDVEGAESATTKRAKESSLEGELYLHLFVVVLLIDSKLHEEARVCATALIDRLQSSTRRTVCYLIPKAFFYYSLAHELTNRLEDIRETLLAAQRTACLRHDDDAQAALLNLLLRNYVHYNLYDQADKLVSKSTFPEASNNQNARRLYYLGKIKSVQLDYTEAYQYLMQAVRKAPQSSARGFRLTVHKLACIVQLLMGEIPDRGTFFQPGLSTGLRPYLELVQKVRVGDLGGFNSVLERNADLFKLDKTYTLIIRLRANVIKAGLRKISVAYSRISLADVSQKLHLDSVEETECLVAKAIRDGVIEATIDHDAGFVRSKENADVYSTQEPQLAFHKRISFCLDIHNEAIKAMRYPPNAHQKQLESDEERLERLAQEQELAKTIEEEEEEDY